MKIKVSEATLTQLNWLVAKARGAIGVRLHTYRGINPGPAVWVVDWEHDWVELSSLDYSTDWAQGGPIIERESIGFTQGNEVCDDWVASYSWVMPRMEIDDSVEGIGPTPLIAAMRCYVASKLGDEVEIPEELQ